MAPVNIAADLAASYYAAQLRPDPTLGSDPDPEALASYRATGNRFAAALLHPTQRATIRCVTDTYRPHRIESTKALALVHNRRLLIVQHERGRVEMGNRLTVHELVDLPMAEKERQTAALVWCELCCSLHELPFDSLRDAGLDYVSYRREKYRLGPLGEGFGPEDKPLPDDPRMLQRQSFAVTTGPLDGASTLLIRLPLWRQAYYHEHSNIGTAFNLHWAHLKGGEPFNTLDPPWLINHLEGLTPDATATRTRRVAEAHR